MPAPPQQRAPARFIGVYAFAYASLWLALPTPAMITLALRVRQLASSDAARPISVVLFAGANVALVANPIFGALSDRTRSRFGRRRPYLVGSALCGFAALALIGVAASLSLVAPANLAFSRGDYTLLFLVAGAVPLMGAALLSPLKSVR